MAISNKVYDKESAMLKLAGYCVYQERSQQEVREKLTKMDLPSTEIEEIISNLIDENFLNEERFAMAYAIGKFRIKNWGKIKIKSGLKFKNISEYCIKKALSQIKKSDYIETLELLIIKKSKELIGFDSFVKNQKIANYLISKGFETEIIWDTLNNLKIKK